LNNLFQIPENIFLHDLEKARVEIAQPGVEDLDGVDPLDLNRLCGPSLPPNLAKPENCGSTVIECKREEEFFAYFCRQGNIPFPNAMDQRSRFVGTINIL
jgi:hypothetical protein